MLVDAGDGRDETGALMEKTLAGKAHCSHVGRNLALRQGLTDLALGFFTVRSSNLGHDFNFICELLFEVLCVDQVVVFAGTRAIAAAALTIHFEDGA